MNSHGPPHMAVQKQDDQHEHTFSSYVRIRDVVLKTYLGRWTIGRSGERGSGISVLPARHDDDDDDYYTRIFLVLLPHCVCIANNSIKHESFVYTQLNDQTVLFRTIQFSTSHLFVLSLNVKQFYLSIRLEIIEIYLKTIIYKKGAIYLENRVHYNQISALSNRLRVCHLPNKPNQTEISLCWQTVKYVAEGEGLTAFHKTALDSEVAVQFSGECGVPLLPGPLWPGLIIFTQPLRSGRIWHKVNFLSGV